MPIIPETPQSNSENKSNPTDDSVKISSVNRMEDATIVNYKKVFEEGEEITVPVLKEELRIDKELHESGKVRIIKKVNEEKTSIEVPLNHTEVNVERKFINKYVNADLAAVRYEGDTMIVSVLKEVVVVEKKTLLVEELHITKTEKQEVHKEDVLLRTEQVSVERQKTPDENEVDKH